MTSTLTPPGAAGTDRAPRTMVLADLLPTEIVHARLARKVRRAVLTMLAVFTVVLVAWCGVAIRQTHHARTDLNQAQEGADTLRAKQRNYKDVIGVLAQSATLEARLASLMAADLQWSGLVTDVQAQTPDGVQLTALTCTVLYGPGSQEDSSVIKLPNTTGEKVIGTLTVSGKASSLALIASYVDGLDRRVAGLGNPLVNSFRLADHELGFTAQLDVTDSMLGGRYTSKDGGH
jgi:hypothetical protein